MLTHGHIFTVVLLSAVLGVSSLSVGEDKPDQGSPELRKDMAEMYQKMADCVKAGKSPEECQREVAKDCPVLAKTGQCPIQGGLGHLRSRRGMHSEGMGPMTGPHQMR